MLPCNQRQNVFCYFEYKLYINTKDTSINILKCSKQKSVIVLLFRTFSELFMQFVKGELAAKRLLSSESLRILLYHILAVSDNKSLHIYSTK